MVAYTDSKWYIWLQIIRLNCIHHCIDNPFSVFHQLICSFVSSLIIVPYAPIHALLRSPLHNSCHHIGTSDSQLKASSVDFSDKLQFHIPDAFLDTSLLMFAL